jgi:hypothetical protein
VQAERELAELRQQEAALRKMHRLAREFVVRKRAPTLKAQQRAARDAALSGERDADLMVSAVRSVDNRLRLAATIMQRAWRRHVAGGAGVGEAAAAKRHLLMRERVRRAHLQALGAEEAPQPSTALTITTTTTTTSTGEGGGIDVLTEMAAAKAAKREAMAASVVARRTRLEDAAAGRTAFTEQRAHAIRVEQLELLDQQRRAATLVQAAERGRQQRRAAELAALLDSVRVVVQVQVLRAVHANSLRMERFASDVAARARHAADVAAAGESDHQQLTTLCMAARCALAEGERKALA